MAPRLLSDHDTGRAIAAIEAGHPLRDTHYGCHRHRARRDARARGPGAGPGRHRRAPQARDGDSRRRRHRARGRPARRAVVGTGAGDRRLRPEGTGRGRAADRADGDPLRLRRRRRSTSARGCTRRRARRSRRRWAGAIASNRPRTSRSRSTRFTIGAPPTCSASPRRASASIGFIPKTTKPRFDEGFDPVWQARTNVTEQGWTAELWIPFSQLRFNNAADQVWGLNVRRYVPTLDEDDYWVPIPRTVTAWSSRFGELDGIRSLPSTRRLELLPYVAGASTISASREPGQPVRQRRQPRRPRGRRHQDGRGAEPDARRDDQPRLRTGRSRPRRGQPLRRRDVLRREAAVLHRRRRTAQPGAGGQLLLLAPHRRAADRPRPPATSWTSRRRAPSSARPSSPAAPPPGSSIGAMAAITEAEDAKVFIANDRADDADVRSSPRTSYAVARVQQEFGRNKSTVSGMATMLHRDLEAGSPLGRAAAAQRVRRGRRFGPPVQGRRIRAHVVGRHVAPRTASRTRSRACSAPAPTTRSVPIATTRVYDPTRTTMSGFKAGSQPAAAGRPPLDLDHPARQRIAEPRAERSRPPGQRRRPAVRRRPALSRDQAGPDLPQLLGGHAPDQRVELRRRSRHAHRPGLCQPGVAELLDHAGELHADAPPARRPAHAGRSADGSARGVVHQRPGPQPRLVANELEHADHRQRRRRRRVHASARRRRSRYGPGRSGSCRSRRRSCGSSAPSSTSRRWPAAPNRPTAGATSSAPSTAAPTPRSSA